MVLSSAVTAQVRVSKLVIKTNQSYDLGQSDILVADTLVMMDSSRLILNKLKPENFIRVKVAAIGNHCVIDGKGINGQAGRNGKPGITPIGPCLDGTAGRDGTKGLDGTAGINLFLYLERVSLKGVLTIDISGGNGGRGGMAETAAAAVRAPCTVMAAMARTAETQGRAAMAQTAACSP